MVQLKVTSLPRFRLTHALPGGIGPQCGGVPGQVKWA